MLDTERKGFLDAVTIRKLYENDSAKLVPITAKKVPTVEEKLKELKEKQEKEEKEAKLREEENIKQNLESRTK